MHPDEGPGTRLRGAAQEIWKQGETESVFTASPPEAALETERFESLQSAKSDAWRRLKRAP